MVKKANSRVKESAGKITKKKICALKKCIKGVKHEKK